MSIQNSFFIDKRFYLLYSAATQSKCGRNSVVECHLAKVDVDGSNPFARSSNKWRHSQVAKAAVCKTVIHRFKSGCRLQIISRGRQAIVHAAPSFSTFTGPSGFSLSKLVSICSALYYDLHTELNPSEREIWRKQSAAGSVWFKIRETFSGRRKTGRFRSIPKQAT